MPAEIFINYRRDDTNVFSARLEDGLVREFGPNAVFRDSRHLKGSQDWPDELRRAVRSCRVMLVIIGSRWQDASDTADGRKGQPRLYDPTDWVRREIGLALDTERMIVPICADTATMPSEAWLRGADLDRLSRKNAFSLRTDAYAKEFPELVALLCESCPDLIVRRAEVRRAIQRRQRRLASIGWAFLAAAGVLVSSWCMRHNADRNEPPRDAPRAVVPANSDPEGRQRTALVVLRVRSPNESDIAGYVVPDDVEFVVRGIDSDAASARAAVVRDAQGSRRFTALWSGSPTRFASGEKLVFGPGTTISLPEDSRQPLRLRMVGYLSPTRPAEVGDAPASRSEARSVPKAFTIGVGGWDHDPPPLLWIRAGSQTAANQRRQIVENTPVSISQFAGLGTGEAFLSGRLRIAAPTMQIVDRHNGSPSYDLRVAAADGGVLTFTYDGTAAPSFADSWQVRYRLELPASVVDWATAGDAVVSATDLMGEAFGAVRTSLDTLALQGRDALALPPSQRDAAVAALRGPLAAASVWTRFAAMVHRENAPAFRRFADASVGVGAPEEVRELLRQLQWPFDHVADAIPELPIAERDPVDGFATAALSADFFAQLVSPAVAAARERVNFWLERSARGLSIAGDARALLR